MEEEIKLLTILIAETVLYIRFIKTGKIDEGFYNKWLELERNLYETE